jgi:hypothetical protein
MWRWKKVLVVGAGVVLGACSSVEHVSAPEAARYEQQPAVAPDTTVQAPQDDPPADTTGGRWGGYMGGGPS